MKGVSYSIIKSLFFSIGIIFFIGVISGTDFSPQKAIAAQNQVVPKPSEIKSAVNSGNWTLAHTLIKKVVAAHPDKPQSWYLKSQIEERLMPSGKSTPQEALASLNKAMELDPTYSFGTSYGNVTELHDRLTTKVNVSEGKLKVFTPDDDPILNKNKIITPSETEPLMAKGINKLSDNDNLKNIIAASKEVEDDSSSFFEYLVVIFIAIVLCYCAYYSSREDKKKFNDMKEKELNRIKSLDLATQLDDMLSKDISYIELDLPREFDSEGMIIEYKKRKKDLVSIMEELLDKNKKSFRLEISKLEELSVLQVTERNFIRQAVEKSKFHMNDIEEYRGKELFEKIESICLTFLCDRLKNIDNFISESPGSYSSMLRVSLKSVSHSFIKVQKDNNEFLINSIDDNLISKKMIGKLKSAVIGFYFYNEVFEKEKQNYRDNMEDQRRALIEEDLRINRELEESASNRRRQEISEQKIIMEAESRRNNPPRKIYRHRSGSNGGDFLSGIIAGSILNSANNNSNNSNYNKNSSGDNRSSSDSTFDFGKNDSGKSDSRFDFGKSSGSSSSFDFGSNKNDDKW
ncbi:putative membrane protein [Pectobacterium atrosepticum SCRI1043]|uniref:Membrane protein n=1 Tax=Pectobacterium atrosepticum (strain SCRI 1043 / ATCC BAA-672) TaxID=218491 RepID=Q6D941_PECAS|nr:hypothetical protein [Pectobacterium atrosepticum]MCL6316873.1 hypothetical protein [Pectobacterium atrosepticum]MCL6321416.1 hypothetical protein [Pectobacterium atrosepticum]CAG73692.1 putative membrane protein [Pectobacterium atrosepticum SCRI1043]